MAVAPSVEARPQPDPTPPAPQAPDPRAPLAATLPLTGFLVLLALAVVFDPTRVKPAWPLSFAAFAAAVAICSAFATATVGLVLALCAWLDYDGFVVGTQGALHWHGAIDGVRLGVLLAVAVVTMTVRRVRRIRRCRRDAGAA